MILFLKKNPTWAVNYVQKEKEHILFFKQTSRRAAYYIEKKKVKAQ